MLVGQNLRRDHQGALITVFGGQDHRKKGQDRFPGTHIALYQSGHKRMACQVSFDLVPDVLLGTCQLIGKMVDDIFRGPYRLHGILVFCRFAFFLQLVNRQDEQQEFIEHQPSAGGQKGFPVPRKVDGFQREAFLGQLIPFPHLRRKEIRRMRSFLHDLPDQLLKGFIGKSCREAIDGLQTVLQRFILRIG